MDIGSSLIRSKIFFIMPIQLAYEYTIYGSYEEEEEGLSRS